MANENVLKLEAALKTFAQTPDQKESEERGREQRDAFLRKFPISSISGLSLDEYCIGKGDRDNFCWWLERGTSHYSSFFPANCSSYGMYFEHATGKVMFARAAQKYKESHPESNDQEILAKSILEPIQKFLESHGTEYFEEASAAVRSSMLLKLLIMYYPAEFAHVNSVSWLNKIIEAYGLKPSNDVREKNRAVKDFYYAEKNLAPSGINEQNFIGIIARQIGLGDAQKQNGDVSYTKSDFLSEVYMSEAQYDDLRALLLRKKNIILQGAPGVGKTFVARRLAYSIIGSKDLDKTAFVQFHQSYSYEDFIRGYKPNCDGFELRDGIFLQFCDRAVADPDNKYFFIIDEINRGNLSKIFGELLVLIEADKRGKDDYAVRLAYGDDRLHFSVPENLYIIGMMNTADRSLAMIDYALRRRFSFYSIEPALDNPKFREDIDPLLLNLVDRVAKLNEAIAGDPSLGPGFKIGHSYFCGKGNQVPSANEIIKYEIGPMLDEYWFDNADKAREERARLFE